MYEFVKLTLLAVVGGLTLSWLFVSYRSLKSPLSKVPGPALARVSRIWEFVRATRGDLHSQTVKLHEKYGPVIRLGPNKYDFNSAEAVKTIYSMTRSFPKSSYYDAFAEPKAEKALFNSRSPQKHSHLRRSQAALYSMTNIKSYEPFVDIQTAILIRKIAEFAKLGHTVSLPLFLQKYAFDVIGDMTFGESFNLMQEHTDEIGVIDLIDKSMILSSVIGIFPEVWTPLLTVLKLLHLPSPKVLYDVAAKYLDQYKQKQTVEKDAQSRSARTFTAKIVQLQAEGKMTGWEAQSVCVNNIIAGSDTTAISLNATLYHIYTIPHVLDRLRDEIDSMAEKGTISDPVTFDESQKMPYLQAVISEALHVHPAVGVSLAREVPEGGATIHGYFFPAGTEVGVNAWGLSYNTHLYGEDVHEFRPERWFERSVGTATSAISQFAFGGGSRTCIGKNISLLEMNKVIPQIVRRFDIKVEPRTYPWRLVTHWFVKQEYECRVREREGMETGVGEEGTSGLERG